MKRQITTQGQVTRITTTATTTTTTQGTGQKKKKKKKKRVNGSGGSHDEAGKKFEGLSKEEAF